MTILNVTPTRMELSRLKKRLTTASRGHKLLKDKQNELVRQFTLMVKENQKLRQKMENILQQSMAEYVLASSSIPEHVLQEVFAIRLHQISLDVQSKTIMNMEVPVLNEIYEEELAKDRFSYGFVATTSELDQSLSQLDSILPLMLKLAEVEKTCQMMATEIESTRRRVNALEYTTIPQLTETISFIERTLGESERSNLTRLMKAIDVIEADD